MTIPGALTSRIAEIRRGLPPVDKFGYAYPFTNGRLDREGDKLLLQPSGQGKDYYDCEIAVEIAASKLAAMQPDLRIERLVMPLMFLCDFGIMMHNLLLVDDKFVFGFTPLDIGLGTDKGFTISAESENPFRKHGRVFSPDLASIQNPLEIARLTRDAEISRTWPLSGRVLDGENSDIGTYLGIGFNEKEVAMRLGVDLINCDDEASERYFKQFGMIKHIGDIAFEFRMTIAELIDFSKRGVPIDFYPALWAFRAQRVKAHRFGSPQLSAIANQMLEESWKSVVVPFMWRLAQFFENW